MYNRVFARKTLGILMAGVLASACVTGCGNDSAKGNADNTAALSEAGENAEESGESGLENVAESADGSAQDTTEGTLDLEISRTVKLNQDNIMKFNDTNGDGYGEFQGWGTSLCWWANRCGYSEKLTAQTAEAFFNPDTGIGMNIGRYNIGGGDNVTEEDISSIENPSPFLHQDHIRRSDSIVPGYAKDVTKIDLSQNSRSYYEENFVRADFECGFAWNYDWDADKNQMNVLIAAAKAAGDEFIGEAFSNSPPYFMTVSGCSSGNEEPSEDNLREDSFTAFACYMADVIEHWAKEGVITFQSASPMNEPATSYWGAFSEKQEGCHFTQGEVQSRILVELNKELKNKGLDVIICGTDETSIDSAITSYQHLTPEAKEVVSRIDTHAYQGTMRNMLKMTAEDAGVNLWMSEVDGTYTMSKKTGAMSAALGFAEEIMKDLNGLMPTAWIMWDAVDLHVDSKNKYDTCSRAEADRIIKDGDPFWGIAIADHDKEEILLSKKYYAYGQFSKYIRPGYCLVESSDVTVAAYNPEDKSVVIVVLNSNTDDQKWEFDLSGFDTAMESITAVRTSGDVETGENWADVSDSDNIEASGKTFTALVKGSSLTTYIIK